MESTHVQDPLCPMCSRPVLAADPVIFGHGDLIHVNCYVGVPDVMERVAALLTEVSGRRFCHTCIAARIHIAYAEAVKATTRLRLLRQCRPEAGACDGCGAPRLTIMADRH